MKRRDSEVEELEKLLKEGKEDKVIEELVKSCPEKDDLGTKGVLTSDEIKHYATKYKMILPFDPGSLKPAGYELHVGEYYAIGGKIGKLYDEPGKNELEIPPFEVAIISTKEIINLPRFIIARWNLRVSKVYEGLLWTGGPQVDPGWVGRLFCPIYNLSSEPVKLKLGEPIVLMDFVKTTPFKKGKTEEYSRPPKRRKLEDYNWRLKSALVTEAKRKMEEIEKKADRAESMVGIIITIIAILFAALSILVTSGSGGRMSIGNNFWLYFSVILSIIAIILVLFNRSTDFNGLINTLISFGEGSNQEDRFLRIIKKGIVYETYVFIFLIILAATKLVISHFFIDVFRTIGDWLKNLIFLLK